MITANPFPTRPSFSELYNYIFDYAKKMPTLCQSGDGTCYYRLGDNACLVGALLTDDQASECGMRAWQYVVLDKTTDAPEWMGEPTGVNFLRAVQRIHDNADTKEDMLDQLAVHRVELRHIYEPLS